MNYLSKEKIKSILEEASGWGCNNQPHLEEAVEAFYELDVTDIEIIDRDELYFKSTKLLSIEEAAFIIGILRPNECTEVAANIYRLWWD